jgi:hypothetical protein
VLASLASLWLVLAPPGSAEAPGSDSGDQPAEPEADLSEARRLFDEGTARYDAADFAGAIETFTLALSELRKQGVSDFRIRGLLLFNIGRTHMRAYGIDDEVEHLRQAKSIFTSFIDEAEKHPDEVDVADIDEARSQLVEIDRLLAAVTQPEPDGKKPKRERKPKQPRDRAGSGEGPKGDPKKLRASGIGLVAGGGALLVGGIGMLAWGAGYVPAAEAAVAGLDGLGLPPESPAFAEGQAFIDSERRKGTTWMAVGGVSVALGVVGVGIGIRQLVTAKRVEKNDMARRSLTPTASFGREGVWFGVSGRF